MFKVLLIGDTHIPSRAKRLPPRVESHILNEKYSLVLCTGDLVTYDVLQLLKRIAEVKVVRGNMDYLSFPESEIVELNDIKVGMIHGHQIYPRGNINKLAKIAFKLGVNILVSGHTHVPLVKKVVIASRNVLLLNPGSATGVWSGGGGSLIPSFIECIVKKSTIEVICYELKANVLVKSYYEILLTR